MVGAEPALQAINTVGFPIVVCLMMFGQYRAEREHRREERDEWQKSLQEVSNTLRDIRDEVND